MNHPSGRRRRTANGQPPLQPQAYTPRQAAVLLAMPYSRVLAHLRSGRIRSRRDGQRFVVPDEAIKEYLAGSDSPAPA